MKNSDSKLLKPNFVTADVYNCLTDDQDQKGKEIKPDLECPSCQELSAEVIELREALKKATKLQTADDMLSGSVSAEQQPKHQSSVSSAVVTIPLVKNN